MCNVCGIGAETESYRSRNYISVIINNCGSINGRKRLLSDLVVIAY